MRGGDTDVSASGERPSSRFGLRLGIAGRMGASTRFRFGKGFASDVGTRTRFGLGRGFGGIERPRAIGVVIVLASLRPLVGIGVREGNGSRTRVEAEHACGRIASGREVGVGLPVGLFLIGGRARFGTGDVGCLGR